jgi:3-hydroxy acid dehydrogenase/malonic semialdehyde reductase
MNSSKEIVLITGASSGFGEAIAYQFAAAGYRLILTARRTDRLHQVCTKIEESYGTAVYACVLDIQDRVATEQTIQNLPAEWKDIDILINNAGLALGLNPIQEGSISDWETMIDTNLKGLLYVSRAIMPTMVARKKGHIINIGSTAAKSNYANGNVYCATKAAVDALSESMRIDLLPHGIKVTAIHPGAAETEFSQVRFHGDAEKAARVYDGFQPLVAADVASVVLYCATLPAHVCINDLVLTCTAQANAIYISR